MSINQSNSNQNLFNSMRASLKNEKSLRKILFTKQQELSPQDTETVNKVKNNLLDVINRVFFNKDAGLGQVDEKTKIKIYVFKAIEQNNESLNKLSTEDVGIIQNALNSLEEIRKKGKGDPEEPNMAMLQDLVKGKEEELYRILFMKKDDLSSNDFQIVSSAKKQLIELLDNGVLKESFNDPDGIQLDEEQKIEFYLLSVIKDGDPEKCFSEKDVKIIYNALNDIEEIQEKSVEKGVNRVALQESIKGREEDILNTLFMEQEDLSSNDFQIVSTAKKQLLEIIDKGIYGEEKKVAATSGMDEIELSDEQIIEFYLLEPIKRGASEEYFSDKDIELIYKALSDVNQVSLTNKNNNYL